MNQRIIQHLPVISYKILNGCIIAIILFSFMTVTKYLFTPHSKYFFYSSIEVVKTHMNIGEPLLFRSIIDRYQVTNMHYEDILMCGFIPTDLFWYSQVVGDHAGAEAGHFSTVWKYDGETPTVPMVCQLRSLPSANLPFGINTEPQVLESPLFYFIIPNR